MTKVLITAPLRQDVGIFREHLASLDRLHIPEGGAVDRFWAVNDCPEVIPEIREASYAIVNTGDEFRKTENDHIWRRDNLEKMPYLRNLTVQWALDNGYDDWLSVDTDLVLHPDTLTWLLEADKDIASEIFWTKGKDGGYWCNAWMYDQAEGMSLDWLEPGLYQVGMTGACTLAKCEVLEAGVNFSPIPCIRNVLWGEDRWFSIRAAVHGFEMWVDTHVPAVHLYTEEVYQAYMARKGAAV